MSIGWKIFLPFTFGFFYYIVGIFYCTDSFIYNEYLEEFFHYSNDYYLGLPVEERGLTGATNAEDSFILAIEEVRKEISGV